MKSQPECPTVDHFNQYLHGNLPNAEVERLEGHLEECSSCLEVLSREAAKTPFFRAAAPCKDYGDASTKSAARVAALLVKVKALRTAQVPSPAAPPAVKPLTANHNDPLRTLSTADLFAPAQSTAELGWLGNYRILEVIGQGGMGVVYRAEDADLDRQVALKVMQPKLAADPEARGRFFGKRKAAAVEHPNIVPIYHVSKDGDTPYFVMPLLRGQSLQKRLSQGLALSMAEVLRIGREVALGLAAAHKGGLIHRDIKPANLWLEEGPTAAVKILDFGLARQEEVFLQEGEPRTRPGTILGTPEFMSPEQARGKTVDFRTDLYSLGVVLYRLAAGQLPFSAATASDYLVAHVTEPPQNVRQVNPAVPPPLAAIIMQLLEKEPGRRPESARVLAETLERLLVPNARPTLPWRRWLAAAGTLAAALLVAFVVWLNRDQGISPATDENPPITTKNQPVQVKMFRVSHRAQVIEEGERRAADRGVVGEKSFETKYDDEVKIAVELTRPAYAYLIAFNADGQEQFLRPKDGGPEPKESLVPPLRDRIDYPPPKSGRGFRLDDEAAGGLQAFAVVVSLEPLPAYREWKKLRGPAAWQKLPPGSGVWSSDGEGIYRVVAGRGVRGTERPLLGVPPLLELCNSLQQGRKGLMVEALAFPVRAKE